MVVRPSIGPDGMTTMFQACGQGRANKISVKTRCSSTSGIGKKPMRLLEVLVSPSQNEMW